MAILYELLAVAGEQPAPAPSGEDGAPSDPTPIGQPA
jgi:hypothetical protein